MDNPINSLQTEENSLNQDQQDNSQGFNANENNDEHTAWFSSLISETIILLVIKGESSLKSYIKNASPKTFRILETDSTEGAVTLAEKKKPDIIIADGSAEGMSGVELCIRLKENSELNYIPVLLLSSHNSEELRLEAIKAGAEDFISGNFDKELLVAKLGNLLKSRKNIYSYFFREAIRPAEIRTISANEKDFFQRFISIIEMHIKEPEFNISLIAQEFGISHSALYKRVKSVAGKTIAAFIREIKLRKAAELMINTECNIEEAACEVGFADVKYFREQFTRLFDMRPSDFKKRYKRSLSDSYRMD